MGHTHAFKMISPHAFGEVVIYQCTSCSEKKSVVRLGHVHHFVPRGPHTRRWLECYCGATPSSV